MGDFNLSGSALVTNAGVSVSAYQTMTAAGPGHAVDPLNTNPENDNETWDDNAAFKSLFSETAKNLQYRDDLQLMTQNVFDGTKALGLEYIPGTEHVFGNNGSVGVHGNASSGSNTALNDLEPNPPISTATLLADLTTASDHLAVVADYTFAPAASVPEPASWILVGMGGLGLSIFWGVSPFFHSELARCYASPNKRGIETDFCAAMPPEGRMSAWVAKDRIMPSQHTFLHRGIAHEVRTSTRFLENPRCHSLCRGSVG